MKFVLALVALVSLVRGDDAVVTLTKDNFEKFIKDNPVSLVEFYAPWCSHCKKLAPEYETAAQKLKETNGIPLAKVDATAEADLGSTYGVRGYPTIKLMRNGKAEDYGGGRTADQIVSWVESMTGAPVVEVANEAEAKQMAETLAVLFLGGFTSKESEAFKTYESVADASRSFGKFCAYFAEGANDEVQVFRTAEEPESIKVRDEASLGQWVGTQRFPLFGKIDGETYAAYVSREQDLVWFAGTTEEFEAAGPAIRKTAQNYRDGYSFVWLDVGKYASHASQSLGIDEFPGLVLQTKGGRFVYPGSTFNSAEEITAFFADVSDGKIQRTLKSEAIPSENDGPVKIVVGNTFEDIVFAEGKDVFLEVYAPWCGHCKKLEPTYQQFAELLSGNSHVVIAKMDGTANEAPVENFEWHGFPTLFFVQAGKKEPLHYEGERSLKAMVEYVKAQSTKPLVVDSIPEEKDEL